MVDTTVHYLYRDGSNYKFRSSFAVKGKLTLGDIEPYLIDGQYFLPASIGIPSLVPIPRDDDDHDFHEIEDLVYEPAQEAATSADFILNDFRTSSERGWFFVHK